MSYSDKIEEFQSTAELCFENAKYNSTVNRAYYSAFLLAKKKIWGEGDQKKSHNQIQTDIFMFLNPQLTHTGIPAKITNEQYSLFKRNWQLLKKNRTNADYRIENIKREIAKSSLQSLKVIKGIINDTV